MSLFLREREDIYIWNAANTHSRALWRTLTKSPTSPKNKLEAINSSACFWARTWCMWRTHVTRLLTNQKVGRSMKTKCVGSYLPSILKAPNARCDPVEREARMNNAHRIKSSASYYSYNRTGTCTLRHTSTWYAVPYYYFNYVTMTIKLSDKY